MQIVRLGKTELVVSKNGFGALPIQRISQADAVYLLQKAFDNGINYYDTARWYTDSEEKMGAALSHVRDKIVISTKTGATEVTQFWSDLETSLTNLKTDYIGLVHYRRYFSKKIVLLKNIFKYYKWGCLKHPHLFFYTPL